MSEVDVVHTSEVVVSSDVKNVAVEEDLKKLLPSVKNLAIAFTSSVTDTRNHSNIDADVIDEVIRKPAAESYVPPYTRTYYPAEPNTNMVATENGSIGTTNGEGDVVRGKSKSPIPAAGNLRSSIAFFENLKK